jgi:serine/threonine protein kinase
MPTSDRPEPDATWRPWSAAAERFELVRTLGAGGMGIVQEARDRTTGARVALKSLYERDGQALFRFKREFRALTDVTHPNLVRLYELVVADDGSCFFTMELVDGAVDLVRWLRAERTGLALARTDELTRAPSSRVRIGAAAAFEEPASVDERAELDVDLVALRAAFRQVAEGVEALHRAGKLHRDLKPSNVLVRPNGHVAILDFGLAADLREVPEEARSPGIPEHVPSDVKSSDSSRRYDSTERTISGTALYMSPEQVLAGPLTPASDWYAVGVMLFEALTGFLPIAGDGLSVMVRKTIVSAVRPSVYVAGIPQDLDDLCLALLDPDADQRPSAATILSVLGGHVVEPTASAPFVGRDDAARDAGARVSRLTHAAGAGARARRLRRGQEHAGGPLPRAARARRVGVRGALLRAGDRALEGPRRGRGRARGHRGAGHAGGAAAVLPQAAGALARMFPGVARITDQLRERASRRGACSSGAGAVGAGPQPRQDQARGGLRGRPPVGRRGRRAPAGRAAGDAPAFPVGGGIARGVPRPQPCAARHGRRRSRSHAFHPGGARRGWTTRPPRRWSRPSRLRWTPRVWPGWCARRRGTPSSCKSWGAPRDASVTRAQSGSMRCCVSACDRHRRSAARAARGVRPRGSAPAARHRGQGRRARHHRPRCAGHAAPRAAGAQHGPGPRRRARDVPRQSA